jgi:F-type H+-transporting ATPase subunit b
LNQAFLVFPDSYRVSGSNPIDRLAFLLNIDLKHSDEELEGYMQLLTPGLGLIIWTLLAFLVVFFILKKFAWPAILGGLQKREQTIADSLATAERIKLEMAQMKSENEAILAKAREERAQMLKEARETKDKIINEAKEQAKIEGNKIIVEAQSAINAQKMAALTEVKNQIGKLVIEVTEKVLRKELSNKEAQEAHIKDMVNEVKLN